jgi:hypothetical protein
MHMPHTPSSSGLSSASATDPTSTFETPAAAPRPVFTSRMGIRTRTRFGWVALSNEMHGVLADGTASGVGSVQPAHSDSGTEKFTRA